MYGHIPVMVREAMDILKPQARKKYLDATIGSGGHAILKLSAPDGRVLGLDWDEAAILEAQQRLKSFEDRLILRRANFTAAKEILKEIG
jgi:16S rRNA (cytosine1402-N4)-methyltransferase